MPSTALEIDAKQDPVSPAIVADSRPASHEIVFRKLIGIAQGSTTSLLALLLVLFGLSLLVDPTASLGSDIAGKTATMDSLRADGDLDIGYWAESFDPDGSLHPFYGTANIDDRWINATTLPMLLLAAPLHRVGGLHLAMLIPVMGGLLAASAARAMAREFGSVDGSMAFWLVGLASPTIVYSLAFWEHSLGLGLMAWGLVFVMRSIDRPSAIPALLSGVAFGLAATMRQEALVYGFAAGLLLTILLLRARGVLVALRCGIAMVSGTIAVLASNTALEVAVLGESFRNGRSGNAAGNAGGDLAARINDALLTTLVMGDVSIMGVAFGLVMLGCLIVVTVSKRPPRELAVVYVIPGCLYLVMAIAAVAGRQFFIPSLLFSTPLVAGSFAALARHRRAIPLFVYALASLPLVFAFQTTGALEAQWGGRYLLLSGWALVVVAATGMRSMPRQGAALLITLGVVASGLGVSWTISRSHQVSSSFDDLAARDASAIVFESPLVGREGSLTSLEIPSLSAPSPELRREASLVLRAAGIESFDYVAVDEGQELVSFEGFNARSSTAMHFVGSDEFRVTTFVVAP